MLVAVTTLSFDIAGLELYLPLVVGAHSRDRAAGTAADPRAARGTPRAVGRDRDAGDADDVADAASTRAGAGSPGFRALCGGEALPLELADELLALRDRALEHVRPDRDDDLVDRLARCSPASRSRSAGRSGTPLCTSSIRVCTRCRSGVAGELYIGGAGLARGYLTGRT